MTAIITNKFRLLNARKFIEGFDGSSLTENRYLFIGRTSPWANDTMPPLPLDSVDSEMQAWDDMLSLKRVVDLTVSNLIPRINWDATGETVYVAYSSADSELFNHPTAAEISDGLANSYTPGNFYVVTDEYNVYKCIDNNNGAKSTVKPTGSGTTIFETVDGYKWKFMYQINSGDLLKYFTSDWMPVKTLLSDDGSSQWDVQQAASDGAIDYVKVLTPGSGYVFTDSGTATSGSTNTVALRAGASATNDVYNGSTIYITAGTGVGQIRLISDYDGATKVATVSVNWGVQPDNTSVYQVLPTVTISGNGSGAQAKPVMAANTIDKINIIASGTNYSFAEVSISGGGGTGATAQASISPSGGHGKDPVKELGGFFVMMSVELAYNEGLGDFPITNDYRRIGIAINVNDITDTLASQSTLRATKRLTISTVVGTFQPDEEITSSGATGIVVQFTDLGGGNGLLDYYQDGSTGFEDFVAANGVAGTTSAATATISIVEDPEVKLRSGEIIYMEHRRPIMRAPDQLEQVRLICEF